MDNQRNALLGWAYRWQGKTMEELKHSLLYTVLELEQTRVAAQEELKKRDAQLLHFKDLLVQAVRERDEAQHKYQSLVLLQNQQQQSGPFSGVSSIEDSNNNNSKSNNGFSSSDCEESIVSSPTIQPQLPELAPEKQLPAKGKLLEAVMKAGPLLQNLLLAGPLPQWKHPPPLVDPFEIPPVKIPQPPQLPLPLHQDSDSLIINTHA